MEAIMAHHPTPVKRQIIASRDVSEMEQSAAPAGGIRNPAPGRPRAAVRPYYEGLSSMTGRGADEGGRKPAGSGEPKAARVCVRKNGPGDRKAAMARREAPRVRKGTCLNCMTRHLARHPLALCGDKEGITAHPAPQRIRAMTRARFRRHERRDSMQPKLAVDRLEFGRLD